MAPYYNLSYFVESLPPEFDSWNSSLRLSYYDTHLQAFSFLGDASQEYVADSLGREDIQDLYSSWKERTDISTRNTTYFLTFLQETLQNTTNALPVPQDVCTNREALQALHHGILILMLAPAVLVLAILMFVRSRKALCNNCCWGRPSVIYPVNFVDEYGRRWAYAACFAIITRSILDFIDGTYIWKPGNWDDEEWDLRYGWVLTLIVVGNVLHLGFLFYPLFACVAMRRRIIANIIGLFYLLPWIYFDVSMYVDCPQQRDPETNRLTVTAIGDLIIIIPILLGEAAVGISFILDFCINVRHLCKPPDDTQEKRPAAVGTTKETLPLLYIKTLMLRNKTKPAETFKGKLKGLVTYTKLAGFKYSPRVVCTMVVAAISLIVVSLRIAVSLDNDLSALQNFALHGGLIEMFLSNETAALVEQIPTYVVGVRWSIFLSNVLSAVMHVIFMVHMIITYRRDMRRKLAGDHSWHYKVDMSPANYTVAGMRYSGYQIGYLVYGYFIMFVLLAVVTVLLTVFIIVPLKYGERNFVIDKIIRLAPTVAIGLLLFYIQIFLAKFCFLQDRGKYMALNNRRLYHVASYYVFFFNIVLGLFSVLKRTLLSLVFGTLLISRLDRCLMMRGFENFDQGFKAYLGMLTVDVYHNHPILKGFIYILRDEVRDSKEFHQKQQRDAQAGHKEIKCQDGINGPPVHRYDKRVRNKWWKILTLVNNPSLVLDRLQRVVEDNKAKGHPLKEGTVEIIANAGAIVVGGVMVSTRNVGQSLVDATSDLINSTSL